MCVHRTDNGQCKKYSDNTFTSYCVDGPCPDDTPTNADHIRGMSDEELEDGMRKIGFGYRPWCALSCVDNCNRCLLDWLRQPAETEGME